MTQSNPMRAAMVALSMVWSIHGVHAQSASQLGEPVENMTRLAGSFDFTLQWRPDAAGVADDGTRASLFTALREQLGLQLDARRTAVDVIVIDRLSLTPAPNEEHEPRTENAEA